MTFPLSPFAIPVGSFPFPVPPPGEKPGGCDSLTVTFPGEWLPYILGALQQLTLQATWQGTPEEQGVLEARAWAIIEMFGQAKCPPAEQAISVCCDGDNDMGCGCLRFQNGVLQQFCCGQWVNVEGQSQPSGQNQPGPQPSVPTPGGGEATTCFQLGVNQRTFAPFIVNSGDTILITDPSGATTDGIEVIWRGPSGEQFFNNTYIPQTQVTKSGDQIPTSPHMGLIAFINGTAYDVYNGNQAGNPQLFTVPPGVVNQSVVFGINKPNDGMGDGNISFCAQFTNNQARTWVHEFDFTLSQFGWTAVGTNGSGPGGIWTAGAGWSPSDVTETAGGDFRRITINSPVVVATDITGMDIFFDLTKGTYTDGTRYGLQLGTGPVQSHNEVDLGNGVMVDGAGQTKSGNVLQPAQTQLSAYLASAANNTATFDGSCAITKIVVRGNGNDPF